MTTFYQPLDGYCYNSDSVILYDFICKMNIKGDVLEVGSGCGIIGILCARDLEFRLTQIEIQKDFAFLSNKNAKSNGIDSIVLNIDFLKNEVSKKYDYIISNPPYYKSGNLSSKNKSIACCKMSSFLKISDFFRKVKLSLKPKGYFIFCYESSSFDKVCCELDKNNLCVETVRFVYPNEDKKSKLVLISARINSKSSMDVLSPLFIQNNMDFSDEMTNIYKNANTWSIKCRL